MSGAQQLDRIIAGSSKIPVFCRLFENVLWRDREATLVDLGFNPIPRSHLHELSKGQAALHLTTALAEDLCYGGKLLGKGTASELAAEFIGRLHWQARFFANTAQPLQSRSPAFAFSPLSDATIDTGVIAKTGEWFAGLLWVFSYD